MGELISEFQDSIYTLIDKTSNRVMNLFTSVRS
jgi:hypothetical protein